MTEDELKYNQTVMGEIFDNRFSKPVLHANKPKEAPLVLIEDIMLMCGKDKITSCSLNLYGSDCDGDEGGKRYIDVRRVTIGFKGEELETESGEISDYLVNYYYENK